jgi:hypothetical protein
VTPVDDQSFAEIPQGLISGDELDILALLRFALERRDFEGKIIKGDGRSTTGVETADPNGLPKARWYEATSFMEAEPERIREMVVTFLGAAHANQLEIVLWIRGEPGGIVFRYAVVIPDGRDSECASNFELMLKGAFPGIKLVNLSSKEVLKEKLNNQLASFRARHAAGLLVGIPSERVDTPIETRLDEILNGLAGRCFDVLVQATPASAQDVDLAVSNLGFVADLAHRLTRQQISVSDSQSLSASLTEGYSNSRSATRTRNWSTTQTEATSKITNSGTTVLAALCGAALGAASGAPPGPQLGMMLGSAVGNFVDPPRHQSQSTSTTTGEAFSEQVGDVKSESKTQGETVQKGISLSQEQLNRQAGLIGEVAEAHLKRIRQMKRFGGWHVSVCVAANKQEDLRLTGSLLSGALRGDLSDLEAPRLLFAEKEACRGLLDGAARFRIARLARAAHPLIPGGEQPKSFLSSEELAHWFRPPSSPVVGVDVRPAVRFAASTARVDSEKSLRLGHLIASGRPLEKSQIELPLNEIARHCFIAGTTGSGKTTTVTQILSQLAEQQIPFLVLEPAKTEYRAFFDSLRERGLNPLRLTLREGSAPWEQRLQFNPWRVPFGTPLGRYIEGMKILIRSCFTMHESLPQILERAIFKLYADQGWTDLSEIVSESHGRRFPTFADFVTKQTEGSKSFIGRIVEELGYSSEPQRNLTAAVTVRLESFTRGMKLALFNGEGDGLQEIFGRPVFVELADLNEPDIKRFLLGAIVLRLAADLQARNPGFSDSSLQHVTVLEEAHHFLREAVGYGPGAELARESNLLLADAFAEMRSYGEGILVADQAPAELSPAVLRNTNIKIAHRLMYQQDCDAMGDAMGLDDSQKRQLRALDTGECIVQAASIPRPVQCQIERP